MNENNVIYEVTLNILDNEKKIDEVICSFETNKNFNDILKQVENMFNEKTISVDTIYLNDDDEWDIIGYLDLIDIIGNCGGRYQFKGNLNSSYSEDKAIEIFKKEIPLFLNYKVFRYSTIS